MASLDKFVNKTTSMWRLRFMLDKRRHTIYLPKCNKRSAQTVQRHVEELIRSRKLGLHPENETVVWAATVDGKIRGSLISAGLLGEHKATGQHLGEFLEAYLTSRTDLAVNSRENYLQTCKMLNEFFGEKHPLRSINAADAARFRSWLQTRVIKQATESTPEKTMADATLSKHIKRAKTMFNAAAEDGLYATSPFAAQKGLSEANKERFFFVTYGVFQKVLAACPDHNWRLILALPRLAGMRCPSEVGQLKWSDIDWEGKKIRIKAKKTKERLCPLFPELAPLLAAAREDSESQYCIGHHRQSANLATNLHRIIVKAGLEPWPKTFVNLRSTRRTELQERFPSHVINEWLGQSTAVASKHYLQVTEGHWEAGTKMVEKK